MYQCSMGSEKRLTKVGQVRFLSSAVSFGAKRMKAVVSSGSYLSSVLVNSCSLQPLSEVGRVNILICQMEGTKVNESQVTC